MAISWSYVVQTFDFCGKNLSYPLFLGRHSLMADLRIPIHLFDIISSWHLPVIFFRQSLIKDVTFLPIISKRILDTSGHQGRPRADRGIYTLFQLVLGRYNSWDEGLKIFRHVLLNTLQSNIIYFTFGPWMATYSLKTFRLFFVWFQNYFS